MIYLINYIPIINLALGFMGIFFISSNPILAAYLLLAGALISIIVILVRKHLNGFGNKIDTLSRMVMFGVGVAFLAQSQLSSFSPYMVFLPLLFFLSTAVYLAKHQGVHIIHTIPPVASGVVVPILFILQTNNAFILSGWLLFAGAIMFFKFTTKSGKAVPKQMKGKEVDFGNVPMFEVDEEH